jgi:hypothetical protein
MVIIDGGGELNLPEFTCEHVTDHCHMFEAEKSAFSCPTVRCNSASPNPNLDTNAGVQVEVLG